jgi:hypothetical protein
LSHIAEQRLPSLAPPFHCPKHAESFLSPQPSITQVPDPGEGVSFAFTNPEKIVMLETATAVTTLRLIKDRRVRPLEGGWSFMVMRVLLLDEIF